VSFYHGAVVAFALAFVVIGVTMIVVTTLAGGGIGYLLGGLFAAFGVGRLVLLRQRR